MKQKLVYSDQIPQIYPQLKEKFGVDWDRGVIIAWNGKIHSKEIPPPQKWIHEAEHLLRQQEIGNEAWWHLYLESEQFRLEEETLACIAEANFIKRNIKNRELKNRILMDIAKVFSGEMYGGLISFNDAMKILSK